MIFDCFTFYNELDLLEIRLNELNDFVDFFVIVEATHTFTGIKKPLFYQENANRYRKYFSKIIHVIINNLDNPPKTTHLPPFNKNENIQKNSEYWNREFYQRNCIMKGLSTATGNDLILIGDVDEIPKPAIIKNIRRSNKIQLLQMDVYYYYFNCHSNQFDNCTRILTYNQLQKTTPQKVRWLTQDKCKVVKHGGWHFSYIGKPQIIQNKIKSFSHQEYNFQEFNSIKNIKFNIDNNLDLFHRSTKYSIVPIGNNFPKYIVNNQTKLKRHIKLIIKTDQNTKFLQQTIVKSRDYINKLNTHISNLLPLEQELNAIKNSKFYKIWQLYLNIKKSIFGAS